MKKKELKAEIKRLKRKLRKVKAELHDARFGTVTVYDMPWALPPPIDFTPIIFY